MLGSRRFTTDMERVLFARVANRAIDPALKLAPAEMAYPVAIPGPDSMEEDRAYRAMDLLVEAVAGLLDRKVRQWPHLVNTEVATQYRDQGVEIAERQVS